MQVLKIIVKPQRDRLDQVISDQIKSLSRSQAKKLINEGYITVNDHPTDPSYQVSKGDTIKIEIPAPAAVELKAENIPLTIVYEDADLLVVDKPDNLVVHPTLDHPNGTVVNALLNHLNIKNLETSNLRPGIVHRLDKDTSGLLVVGKNMQATDNLKKQFKEHSVMKKYLALVGGIVEKETGLVDQKIARHPKFRSKFTVSPEGREARTEYRVLKRFKNATLLELTPFTGRTHQLRVHLASIGHPILGDKLYGGRMLLNRQFLHASYLSFIHPKKRVKLEFESPLPADLSAFLEKVEKESK